jgi:hypothetical protein
VPLTVERQPQIAEEEEEEEVGYVRLLFSPVLW